jgi:hypothetical protein
MDAHVIIEFNPGMADANISASLNLDKDIPVGTWSYSTYSGGVVGGKVKVSRTQAETRRRTE